ncbi:pentapeptide repeat-containing protein [Streptomyces sp. 372A]
MRGNRRSRTALDERELRLWKVGRALAATFVAAVVIAGGVFYSLLVLLNVKGIDATAKLDAATLFDLVKLSFGVVAGSGALVALVVAYRRQRVDEAGAHREATRLHTERFSQAVDKLGSDSPAVRLGGVHALAGLADDAPDQSLRQTCIDVLCAYLQLPYTADPGDEPAHQEEHHRYLSLRKVRHTIMRLIGDHYRRPRGTHRSWQGCDLDLTGISIDGDMDFGGAVFSSGTVNFQGAHFSDGTVNFFGAEFSGGTVNFDEATFLSGWINFNEAKFSNGMVTFRRAEFCGATMRFGGVTVSGGRLNFFNSNFSGSKINFHRARLPLGAIEFLAATFSGGSLGLQGVTVSGGRMDFFGSEFTGGIVNLTGAEISSGRIDLRNTEFSGGATLFKNAIFSGGQMRFQNAVYSGGLVDFRGATFSNCTSEFQGATGASPLGLIDAVGTPVPPTVSLPPSW